MDELSGKERLEEIRKQRYLHSEVPRVYLVRLGPYYYQLMPYSLFNRNILTAIWVIILIILGLGHGVVLNAQNFTA